MTELSSRYNFKDVEDKWCKFWEERGIFHAKPDPKKKPYTVVIPPPNVTGILHMGHALNNTLQDIIIRYKRMKGFEALWMPGTDHAGIATQNVVEKNLAKEGKRRQDIGREEFLKLLWAWKNQYGGTIIHQLKKIGSSCDWQRTRFTMDDNYSAAVRDVFVSLYEKNLIYRGQYIINWCPRCQTALSDEEAEHKELPGNLYHIRYPFKDNPKEYVVVATTRPETMLGDTAVAVNPKDKRYRKLIGKTLVLPILNREIKIIADEFVDPKFGSGAVKVTPAHDPNDFAMGKRHNLEFINIMHPDAKLNQSAGPFSGEDRFKARSKIIETLKDTNLLDKVEPHTHAVGHCYRCNTVVEPYLSKQWFVKMAPLAKPAIEAVKKGKIKFHPDRWTKVYLNWMENIRDWCISRQIWWGHRIPVWYCQDCKGTETVIVARETPEACPKCKSANLKQDEDVLDTWFSSWLWPFATLGWPKKNKDLEYFYPTASLFTASEIIFFWVARMIMAGIEFMKDIPFSDVYIHGTVRDAQGRKMSKSLGNALDPLEIIKEYGTDALRFSLIINSGQDLFISKEKFEIGRNFANKIWNASRLILMNLTIDPNKTDINEIKAEELDLPSKHILSSFHETLSNVEKAINDFRFSEAEVGINAFFWATFCDWYLEIVKNDFSNKNSQKVAYYILENSLKMIHPFMPFVTEEIWSHLPHKTPAPLSLQDWPKPEKRWSDPNAGQQFGFIAILINKIRHLRSDWNIKPQDQIDCYIHSSNDENLKIIEDNVKYFKWLGNIENLNIEKTFTHRENTALGVVEGTSISIPLGNLVDIKKEKDRVAAQINEHSKLIDGLQSRLSNQDFLNKAPKDVVEKEQFRLQSLQLKVKELNESLKNLG